MAWKSRPKRSWNSYLTEFDQHHKKANYEYVMPEEGSCSPSKIFVKCPIHEWFEIRLQEHRRGRGCQKCRFTKRGINGRITMAEFITRSIEIHGDHYDYSQSFIENGIRGKTTIGCQIHGKFEQIIHDHMCGHGCPVCKRQNNKKRLTKTFDQFVTDARKIHGNRFDYDTRRYVDRTTKTKVICLKHGHFLVRPSDHIHKASGCPVCKSKNFVSKLEVAWLNKIGLPDDFQHRQVWLPVDGKKVCVDGFEPMSNTIYLFHGDYWHGNPKVYEQHIKHGCMEKTYGELYKRTMQYEAKIKQNGYNLVTMWESDFRALQKTDKPS